MSVLPFDLTEIILAELRRQRRGNDGLLHASSHLTGSLRHAQLDVAGAPRVQSELLSEITLYTGTMWHEFIHATLRRQGVPYMAEVNMTPWMPLGWGGTLDGLVLNPELKAFVLTDFKTQKGEGMRFIARDGAKEEHRYQTSLYWHAAKKMLAGTGRIAKSLGVWYLPKNDTRSKEDIVEPVLADFDPIPWAKIKGDAETRAQRAQEYRESITGWKGPEKPMALKRYLTDALEPVQERRQTLYFDRATSTYDVLLKPHWSAAYCPFPSELCNCNEQGQTKIGFYGDDGEYYSRPGYEEIRPVVKPA